MEKENKSSGQIINEMASALENVIDMRFGELAEAQNKEIEKMKKQITEKYSDEQFVLISREKLREMMDMVEQAQSYCSQAGDEASQCRYNMEEAESQAEYAQDEMTSLVNKMDELMQFEAEAEEVEDKNDMSV